MSRALSNMIATWLNPAHSETRRHVMSRNKKLGAPEDIFDVPGNKECADCGAAGPTWASWNLGILICEKCCGMHRGLGTHISKVKSTRMDKWDNDQFLVPVRNIGNLVSNGFYEYSVPPGSKYVAGVKSAAGDKIDNVEAKKLERWIRAKYEAKKYAQPGVDPPHVRLARGESLRDPKKATEEKPLEEKSPSKKDKENKEKHRKGETSPSKKEGKEKKVKDDKEKEKETKSEVKEKKSKKDKKEKRSQELASSFAELETWAQGKNSRKKTQDMTQASWDAGGEAWSDASPTSWDGSPGYGTANGFGHPQDYQQGMSAAAGATEQFQPPSGYGMPDPTMAPTGPQFDHGGGYGTNLSYAGPSGPMVSGQMDSTSGFGPYASSYGGGGGFSVEPRPEPDGLRERRLALQSIAGLYRNPENFVPQGIELVPMKGFKLEDASFEPNALKVPRQGASSRLKQPAPGFSGSKGADTGGGCSLSFGGAGYGVSPHGGDTATNLGGHLPMAAGTSPSQAATPCGAYWPGPGGPGGPGCSVLPVPPALANMEQYRPALSPDQAAQDELQRVQAELRALKEEMVQLKQGYHEVKEQQETLGTTVTSIKERQEDDDVLEWWKDPGPGTGLAPTSAQSPSALEAGGGEMQQQIAQILTMLQQQQEQQQQFLERQMLHTSSPVSGRLQASTSSPGFSSPEADLAGWELDLENFTRHAQRFAELDTNQDGYLEGAEAKSHFGLSRLSPVRLAEIWALADEGRDGRLSLPEFVCAAELMERASKGYEMPAKLPPPLWDSALRHAADFSLPKKESWTISPEEWQSCRSIFEAKCNDANFLEPNEAREILDRSELPHAELSQIWNLSDLDGDGQLRFGEFLCAMHLAERRRKGGELPSRLPDALLQVATEDLPNKLEMPVPPPDFEPPVTESFNTVAAESSSDPTVSELEQYKNIFEGLDLSEGLAAAEAKVLERSGLSSNDLAQIWSLSDVDYDGQLALCEFACAMVLTTRRRSGLPVPEELPSALARLVAGAIDLGPLGTQGLTTSKWVIEPHDLQRYRDLFLMECPGSFLSFAEAQEVLSRSQLPITEVQLILQMADLDQDGQLHFGEFAAALHLTALRRQGEKLPTQLPWPLVELAQDAPAQDGGLLPEELEIFTDLFEKLRPSSGDPRQEDVQEVFQRSGLPDSELSQIWRLSDADGDGRLSRQEFVCAMALLQRRREGSPLPMSLPPDLEVGSTRAPSSRP